MHARNILLRIFMVLCAFAAFISITPVEVTIKITLRSHYFNIWFTQQSSINQNNWQTARTFDPGGFYVFGGVD